MAMLLLNTSSILLIVKHTRIVHNNGQDDCTHTITNSTINNVLVQENVKSLHYLKT